MSAQEYDSAPNAPEEDGPPMHPEAMAKFEEMFGDLLLEVKEGRLSQEEGVQAMERRMQAFQGDIVYATKHQDDVCGKKCEFDPVTGKCLQCEAMNKRAREEAEAAMARDTAE